MCRALWVAVPVGLLLAACSEEVRRPAPVVRADASVAADAGADSGTGADAGELDAASPLDAGFDDAAAPDAGPDGGEPLDAAPAHPDASLPDAGPFMGCDPDFAAAGACGGDPVRAWSYLGSCNRTNPYEMLLQFCPGSTAGLRSREVSGRLALLGDGTFLRRLDETVERTIFVPSSCPAAQAGCGMLGDNLDLFDPGSVVLCNPRTGGCECDARKRTFIDDQGTYTISEPILTLTPAGGSSEEYWYCSAHDLLQYRARGGTAPEGTTSFVLRP